MSMMATEIEGHICAYALPATYTAQEVLRVFFIDELDLGVPMLSASIEARIRTQLKGFQQLTIQIHHNSMRVAWWAPQRTYRPIYARARSTHVEVLRSVIDTLSSLNGWPDHAQAVLTDMNELR